MQYGRDRIGPARLVFLVYASIFFLYFFISHICFVFFIVFFTKFSDELTFFYTAMTYHSIYVI